LIFVFGDCSLDTDRWELRRVRRLLLPSRGSSTSSNTSYAERGCDRGRWSASRGSWLALQETLAVVDRMLRDTHVTARGRLPVLGQDSPASQIAERHGACDTAAIGAFVMGRIKQKPTCGLPREGREAGINPSDDPA
jgi:hypothetical protein